MIFIFLSLLFCVQLLLFCSLCYIYDLVRIQKLSLIICFFECCTVVVITRRSFFPVFLPSFLALQQKDFKKKSKKKNDPLGEVNNGIVVFDSYILGQLSIIFVSVLLVSPLLSPLLDFLLSIKLRNEREGGNSLVCRHSFNSILILFLRIFRKYICFNKDESKRWVGRGVVIWWVGFGIEGGKCTHHACRPSYEHVVENGKFFLSLIAYIYIYIYIYIPK